MILAFYGASGLGAEIYESAMDIQRAEHRWSEIIFVDDDPKKDGTIYSLCRVISFNTVLSTYKPDEIEFIITIGEPSVKDKIFKKILDAGYDITNLFVPGARVYETGTYGKGNVVVIGNTIAVPAYGKLGNNVLIQGTTEKGHAVEIGDNCVISSFVFIGGGTKIGRNTYVAPHACIRNGLTIGSNCIIGMGSVVTKDVPDNAVVYGNPARVVRITEGENKVFG